MIKKYKSYIVKEDVDYEEEPDDDDDKLLLIGWQGYDKIGYGDKKEGCLMRDGMIYILQEIVDRDTVILYNDFKHRVVHHDYLPSFDSIESLFTILSQEELEKYIYSNGAQISVHVIDKGGDHFIPYYWDDLPQDIKDQL